MRGKYTLLYLYISVLATCVLSACEQRTIFSQYRHTPSSGWEKNAPVTLSTNVIKEDGTYAEEIGVCINGEYPFKALTLIIEQTRYPAFETWSDTLECQLIDEAGNATGQGVSQYQYVFPLKTLRLHQGDSLDIAIRHDMKREILPGIVNVGLRISSLHQYAGK